jgi:hypothetical protein
MFVLSAEIGDRLIIVVKCINHTVLYCYYITYKYCREFLTVAESTCPPMAEKNLKKLRQ